MEKLYSILRDLLEIEYNQESLLCVLNVLEASYCKETQGEAKMVANTAKYYLNALQGELRTAINRLDVYLAEKNKEINKRENGITNEDKEM